MCLCLFATVVGPPLASVPAAADPKPVTIATSRSSELSADGSTVTVELRIRCAPVGDVLEALVTVSQEQTFAQAGFGAACDGAWHRIAINVVALDAPFVEGLAQVSSFILLCDATSTCVQGQDSRVVKVR
jgi:hypothetical protein